MPYCFYIRDQQYNYGNGYESSRQLQGPPASDEVRKSRYQKDPHLEHDGTYHGSQLAVFCWGDL